jgi:Tfp pilus assembly protein PilF
MENLKEKYLRHYEKALDYFIYLDNPGKAIREFKKVIKLNPLYSQAYFDLAYVYYLNMDISNAAVYYQGYLKLKPHAREVDEINKILSLITYKKEYQFQLAS